MRSGDRVFRVDIVIALYLLIEKIIKLQNHMFSILRFQNQNIDFSYICLYNRHHIFKVTSKSCSF